MILVSAFVIWVSRTALVAVGCITLIGGNIVRAPAIFPLYDRKGVSVAASVGTGLEGVGRVGNWKMLARVLEEAARCARAELTYPNCSRSQCSGLSSTPGSRHPIVARMWVRQKKSRPGGPEVGREACCGVS